MTTIQISLLPGTDLYNALRQFCKYQDSDINTESTLEITLQRGNYYISNALEFRCNVIIRGNTNTIVSATSFNEWTDDSLISIKGSIVNKLKLEVYDTEFRFQIPMSINEGRHYFKAYYCDKIIFRNCHIQLMNGKTSNIDLRRCSNIEIKNCILENYNECSEGGILWIRGETNNVIILGNTFRKHGNDEVIAIWGDGNISTSEVELITKQNILITDNIFEYGRNKSSKYPIDKYIALYDTYYKEPIISQIIDNRHYIWKNIKIANNTFKINDLTTQLIYFSFLAPNTITENISIEYNTISRSEYTIAENEYEVDITIIANKETNCIVLIKNNTVEANHIINANSIGYTHLQTNGAVIDYLHNYINNSRLLHKYNSAGIKLNTTGMKLIECFGSGGDFNLHMNKIIGNYMLAQFSLSPNSTDQIEEVNLTATNNYFEGRNFIFCRKLKIVRKF